MNQRDEQLLALRPTISAAVVTETMTEEEKFQNRTLRPILKWQNPLLLALFREHIQSRKNAFYSLTADQRRQYIAQVLQKDTILRSTLKGVVIGHFTEAEFTHYASRARTLDKRILQMIAQRLLSQLAPALSKAIGQYCT